MRPQAGGNQNESSNGDITYRSRERKTAMEHSERYEGNQEGRQRFSKEDIANGDK